ncbi:MAG TPA: glycosyltransferase [Candidatus Acidoferrum sp.]|nr:glycosyltransferase [Candidatus Acidoferrum sp.]
MKYQSIGFINQADHAGLSTLRLARGKMRVVYISGEPDTPGHFYRVQMYADALARLGHSIHILRLDQIRQNLPLIKTAHAAVVWRAPWSHELSKVAAALKRNGGKLVFDVDDYMFDPTLAKVAIIDGIRSMGLDEAETSKFYERIKDLMMAADYCTCPTKPLAAAMRRFQKVTFVLPNGYDEGTYVKSRRAVAKRHRERSDGLFRMGYAGGSRTHQKDFAAAAPAVARILREHPEGRLVLFRNKFPDGFAPVLDVEEYPDLAGLESQIEWRTYVPLSQLPDEIARFDINLAPLEAGNLFCEGKSELKYYEAALAGVPTVASPTRPYAEAIRHDESGYLAANPDDWYLCLKRLVTEPMLRKRMANEAFFDVLWRNGPERRVELVESFMEQIVFGGRTAANLFALELHRSKIPKRPPPKTAEYDLILEFGECAQSDVDVVIPLYNYSQHVAAALESVKTQTLKKKGLIVVDDCSTDNSLVVVEKWMHANKDAFSHIALLKNRRNSGLANTRNTGFTFADALFVMPLDADNLLLPQCLERCLKAITESYAAVAFPTIEEFGDTHGNRSCDEWCPSRFIPGNYIDAMALIRRTAWAAVGGYDRIEVAGWEDYDLWCKFVHMGLWGVWLPDVLARYRVHDQSMLNTTTDLLQKKRQLVSEMHRRHWWLDISPP